MKYVLCITLKCNLACQYCYIAKRNFTMPLQKAIEVVDFIFKNNPSEEKRIINFSGGEPLLEFDLVKRAPGYRIGLCAFREYLSLR